MPESRKENKVTTPSELEVQKAIGHQFPGGDYLIQHWENFLLTDCTGSEALPDGLVHPVALFHVPILGAGTTISEMFSLGLATSEFSIGIESYEWELFTPLYEDVNYQISGSIMDAERIVDENDRVQDRIQFRFDIKHSGELIARTTVIWHYGRGTTE